MPAPEGLAELVESYQRNRDHYRSKQYNEAQVRIEFIDPLFKLLGWDIHNEQGLAPQNKDVVHEDAIRTGAGEVKAPDYCFRAGGTRKFFVEAKRPSLDLKRDPEPAYQLRRYAWSAKLPLGVLTDFEELAVYDCRGRPRQSDKASAGRVRYYQYHEYADKWDEIASFLSRDGLYRGEFDRFVASTKKRGGTAEVDDVFLQEIESWRKTLAGNIAQRNPGLSEHDINFAVQRIIDRVVFLRICEDRNIETYGRLRQHVNGPDTYRRLQKVFRDADDRYNSGLFHFRREDGRAEQFDDITPGIEIDDKPLRDILDSLYYPKSPYVFSEIPADILGQIYERFLGNVIRLTPARQAKVEPKPEVRKAGGVYYTPTYIVDYIVRNTVGKLLEGKTPGQAERLRVLDPACGSGSFLIGAYQFLLDWHLKWYAENEPEKWTRSTRAKKKASTRSGRTRVRMVDESPRIYRDSAGDWRLSTSERKRILLNNIHGVDIDEQAVEVTKLSLLLKVLEGATAELLEFDLFHRERALPDLGRNIKCGNSLIGPDIYDDEGLFETGFTDEDRRRINAFDWKAEFPEVFAAGGFDAVIGNPPWGASFSENALIHLRRHYTADSNVDSYTLFMERGLAILTSQGLLGFIVPDTFLRKDDHERFRRSLLGRDSMLDLVETGPVFRQVRDTWCALVTLQKGSAPNNHRIRRKQLSRFIVSAEERLHRFSEANWTLEATSAQKDFVLTDRAIVGYLAKQEQQRIIRKMAQLKRLGQHTGFRISRGEEGGKAGLPSSSSGSMSILCPANIGRYSINGGVRCARAFLTQSKLQKYYSQPKIWITRIQKMRWPQRLVCAFDESSNSAGLKTLQLIVSSSGNTNDLLALTGILCSRPVNYWCVNFLADDMNQAYLERIPLPDDNGRLPTLVTRMLELNKRLPGIRNPHERELAEREIASTDRRIDELVYELYGLTEDEIRIVEEATAPQAGPA